MTKLTTTVEAKPWWKSTLVWLGILQVIGGTAEMVTTTPVFEGSEAAGIAAMISGAVTIGLRLITKQPVATSKKPVEVPRSMP